MPKTKQHGGKRPGAGRKPGSPSGCSTCAILLKQLEESAERERRLSKQLDKMSAQIGLVLEAQFETVTQIAPEDQQPSNIAPGLPIETLSDVTTYDDESFLNQVATIRDASERTQ